MNTALEHATRQLVDLAQDEDLGRGDITSQLLEQPDARAAFHLLAKQPCVVAGVDVAPLILAAYDGTLAIEWREGMLDGTRVGAIGGTVAKERRDNPSRREAVFVPVALATVRGPLHSILSVERVLLNFLQRLCGVATMTSAYVDAVAGTGAEIFDTRKTIPGWRLLDRYAVRCGGGRNHREGLFDAVLIKDNHLAGVDTPRLAGTVFDMLNRLAASGAKPSLVEVEADTLGQVEELFKVMGVDVVLLDNFSIDELREAVELRDDHGLKGRVMLEASGGVTLSTVRAVAETGVERISVGAITHSAPAVDLSMERA